MSEAAFYVGLDWGTERHAICVTRANGSVVKERFVPNDATALLVIADLIEGAKPSAVFIGVETPRLPIIDALMAREYRVFSINPKQSDHFRQAESASGAADDRRDAKVIATSLRTHAHCFDAVEPEGSELRDLRAAMKANHVVDKMFRQVANRLSAVVLEAVPTIAPLCFGAQDPWYWDLVLKVLGSKRCDISDHVVAGILKKHRMRRAIEDVRRVLDVPRLHTADGVREGAYFRAQLLVEQLRLLRKEQKLIDARRDAALNALPKGDGGKSDAEIIMTMPGVGPFVASTLVVDAHHAIARRNLKQLRCLCGVAPVTRSTGKQEQRQEKRRARGKTNERKEKWWREQQEKPVHMRYAASLRLRNAMHYAAATAARHPDFAPYYVTQRERGRSHARAARAVGDRMLTRLVAMLRDRTAYRPRNPPIPSSSAVEPITSSDAGAQSASQAVDVTA